MPKRGMDSCGLHALILDSTEMIRTDGSPHIEIQWIIPCPLRYGMVKWKEDQVRQIKESELSRRQNELSNVWLSAFFGNEVMNDDYYELQNHLSPEKFPD